MINHEDFKIACSKLTTSLKKEGVKISHSKLMELVSQSLGYKNYNTFRGMAPEQICIDTENQQNQHFYEIHVLCNNQVDFVKNYVKENFIKSQNIKTQYHGNKIIYKMNDINICKNMEVYLEQDVKLNNFIIKLDIIEIQYTKKQKNITHNNLVYTQPGIGQKSHLLSQDKVNILEKVIDKMLQRHVRSQIDSFKIINGKNNIITKEISNGKGMFTDGGITIYTEENPYSIETIERNARKMFNVMPFDMSLVDEQTATFNEEKSFSFQYYIPSRKTTVKCNYIPNKSLEISLI